MFSFRKRGAAAGGYAALEFTARGIGFASITRADGGPAVLESCEFVAGTAGDWDQRLEDLARRHDLGRRPCSIVVGHDAYSLLLVEAPEVPPEELKAAVRWRIADLIDFHVDDAVIDVFAVPEHRSGARAKMMYVVAARAGRIGERTALAYEAGIDLEVVEIPELAQRNVAAELPEDVAGVGLVHLSERAGLITLTRQSTLYLARRLDVGLDVLRVSAPPGSSAEEPAVRQWLDGLVIELQRSLDYYESNFAQAPIGHLVFAPMPEPVPGLEDYFAAQLGVSARVLDLNDLVDCAEPLDGPAQAGCFAALGAALRQEQVTL